MNDNELPTLLRIAEILQNKSKAELDPNKKLIYQQDFQKIQNLIAEKVLDKNFHIETIFPSSTPNTDEASSTNLETIDLTLQISSSAASPVSMKANNSIQPIEDIPIKSAPPRSRNSIPPPNQTNNINNNINNNQNNNHNNNNINNNNNNNPDIAAKFESFMKQKGKKTKSGIPKRNK